jgi:hypothetical protein|tara:strand:+ start:5133 stop:5297 length:165 start_codon:yes stop_codon:yes gene_type:complete
MGYGKKKKKMSYGAGGSTSLKKMKAASAYKYGGLTGSNKMNVKQFRMGGLCKRK